MPRPGAIVVVHPVTMYPKDEGKDRTNRGVLGVVFVLNVNVFVNPPVLWVLRVGDMVVVQEDAPSFPSCTSNGVGM